MKLYKFFIFVGVLFAISLIVYLTTTPRGKEIPLTGIITGNDVIVGSQLAGRMVRLTVEEGSEVHKGDLIAEIDPAEWIAARDSAAANIRMLENKVVSASDTKSWTDDQTSAAERQAEATLTSTKSQLAQAQANLDLARITATRYQDLLKFDGVSKQEVDQANGTLKADEANLKATMATVDQLKDLDVNRLYVIQEGGKILKAETLTPAKKRA
jgi:multidrug resistance efflux pump